MEHHDFMSYFDNDRIRNFFDFWRIDRFCTLDQFTDEVYDAYREWMSSSKTDEEEPDHRFAINDIEFGWQATIATMALFPIAYGHLQYDFGVDVFKIPFAIHDKYWNESNLRDFLDAYCGHDAEYEEYRTTIIETLENAPYNPYEETGCTLNVLGDPILLKFSIDDNHFKIYLVPLIYGKETSDSYTIYAMPLTALIDGTRDNKE